MALIRYFLHILHCPLVLYGCARVPHVTFAGTDQNGLQVVNEPSTEVDISATKLVSLFELSTHEKVTFAELGEFMLEIYIKKLDGAAIAAKTGFEIITATRPMKLSSFFIENS